MVYEYATLHNFLKPMFQNRIMLNFSLSEENGNTLFNKTTIYLNNSL